MPKMSEVPYLFCLYAEDVRQEVTEQTSIIGVFQGGPRVAAVPTHVPKLAIVVYLRLPPQSAPKSIMLEVSRAGEVLETITPEAALLQSINRQQKVGRDKGKGKGEGFTMQFVIGMTGFAVPTQGKIEVQAIVDGLVVNGNGLEITVGEASAEEK